jgi:HEAT repeat protein
MVIPVLVDLLKDQDTFVRRDAAVALGELGEEARPAVAALLALRTDKETVRRAAADALDKIDSEAAASFRKPVRKK